MKYFGTDGIRGKAYSELSLDLAMKVGQSLSLLGNRKVYVGCDTRESSEDIKNSVIEGAIKFGMDVYDYGVLPTPALILESYYGKALGVMITASHNPYYDNGIKIIKCGYKIEDREKQMIEDYLDGVLDFAHPINGSLTKTDTTYLDFLSKYVLRTKLNILVDASNGATSNYVQILDKVANATYISNEPNGKNINEKCGATHLENLISKMDGYDLGIAFDGDGDRIMVVDDEKNIVDGDKIIYLFAKWFKKHDLLKKDTVVLTVMSNLGIINALEDINIKSVLTNVGDQNVLECMIKNEYNLGGENSGHIITPFTFTGDGLFNAIILLTIISEENKKLSKLLSNVEMYPYKMVNIKVTDKSIIDNDVIKEKVKKYEESFSKYGKIILRASGTEPLIRVTVMHKDNNVMEECLNDLVSLINKDVK